MNVDWLNRMSPVIVVIVAVILCQQMEGSPDGIKNEKHHKYSPILPGPLENKNTFSISRIQTSNNCSSVNLCSCRRLKNGRMLAQCSGLGLTSIPTFSNDVTDIDLSINLIQHFPIRSKFPMNLVSLSLSNNILNSFKNDPFQGLDQLMNLDLSGNKLKYVKNVVSKDLFRDLKNLRVLNLKGNNYNTSEQNYPVEIANLNSLRELHLDGIRDGKFSEHFSKLSFLTTLDFSGRSFDNCRIRKIRESFLINLPHVQILNLSLCDLRDIEQGALGRLSNLRTLDISNNNYLSFRILRNLTYDLQFTNIKQLNLTYLHCPAGVGSMIIPSDIEYLSNTSLEQLYLPYNRIEVLGEGDVKLLPKSLTILYLSYNNINVVAITELLQLLIMPKLKTIDLCCQEKHTHHTRVSNSVNCHDWRGPYINHRQENDQVKVRSGTRQIHEISKIIDRSVISKTNKVIVQITVSPSVTEFDFMELGIYIDRIQPTIEIYVSKPNNIQKVDMEKNRLHVWPIVLKNMNKLKVLNLKDSQCSNISPDSFKDLPSLQYLNIENNLLGKVLSNDMDGKYFKYLKNLTHLMMKNNGIGYVPEKLLHNLSKLKVLTVSINALSEWNADIGHMSQLAFLNLSSNRIQAFNKKTRHSIDIISKTSNITIDLRENTLQCSCNTLDFLKWIIKRKNLFIDFESNTCLHDNVYISMKDFPSMIAKLERNCNNYSDLVIGVMVCISFVLFIICGAIIYRYRWKLRYLYFMAKQGNRHTVDRLQFEFDAFISYANEDGNFVETELLQNMEEHYGLKLRLHRRDFLPGNPIAENITDNIHRSHRTVTILSNNYLNSYWCKFEFNMARMESVYSRGGEPTLFIVLLDNLKPRDLPLMVMDVIDSDSYIKVPEVRDYEFWENFYKGITVM